MSVKNMSDDGHMNTLRLQAESLGIPFVELSPGMVHQDALALIPTKQLDSDNLLPLSVSEGWLTIAVERYADLGLTDRIREQTGCELMVIAADPDNIRSVRADVYAEHGLSPHETTKDISVELDKLLDEIGRNDVLIEQSDDDMGSQLDVDADASPVIKLVNAIIQDAVSAGASDAHIEPGDTHFRVRNRVDGELVESICPSMGLLPAVVSRIKIVAGMDISEKRLPQDGSVSLRCGGRSVDLRVSTMATKYGEKVVMRIADRESAGLGLDDLGMSGRMLQRFRAKLKHPTGIILVTGPTGSGKSSTLYATLAELNSTKANICTIEDPVERRLLGVNQFQVNQQAGMTFARALRSLLRQDPDIMMIGEIRDTETARLATEAALTGHLVFSTLHTNDAVGAIPRLVNMGVEPYLLAATVRVVLAQRLVRGICQHCKQQMVLGDVERDIVKQVSGGSFDLDHAYSGRGCAKCHNTGQDGRVGVFECLTLNEPMLSGVIHDPDAGQIRKIATGRNYITFLDDGLQKVREGLVTLEALLKLVVSEETDQEYAACEALVA